MRILHRMARDEFQNPGGRGSIFEEFNNNSVQKLRQSTATLAGQGWQWEEASRRGSECDSNCSLILAIRSVCAVYRSKIRPIVHAAIRETELRMV